MAFNNLNINLYEENSLYEQQDKAVGTYIKRDTVENIETSKL